MVKSRGEYEKLMDQKLTSFYGTFRDGELLAHMQTQGNDHFAAFSSRSSKRMNSFSPQEFLDYTVARDMVKRGVKLFDRGWMSIRSGIIGLIEYKKKFGELEPRFEVDVNGVIPYDTDEDRYLSNLFFPNNASA